MLADDALRARATDPMSRKYKLLNAGLAFITTHLREVNVRGCKPIVRDIAGVTSGRGCFVPSG